METLKKIGMVFLTLAIFAFLAFAIGYFMYAVGKLVLSIDDTEQVTNSKPDMYEIHANAVEGVEKMLKSPASAEFPTASKLTIVEYEPYNYRVTGYVDAQNSFGAIIRSTWIVDMELKDGYVTYHNIIIN